MRHKNLVVALLLLVAYTGCAIGEVPPPINLQNTTGNFWINHTWDPTPAADVVSLVSGDEVGTFTGFNWTGSTWQSDSVIASGLGDVGTYSAPEVFQKDGTWYLIAGAGYDTFAGFNWTGSTWQSSPGIVSDLGGVGDRPTPTVFQKDSTWYLIAGQNYGGFIGFNWTGSAWQTDTDIVSGLGDVGWYSKPEVFQKGGTWYLISGESVGGFIGFNWTGSAWQTDTDIVSGLVAGDWHSAPEVFQNGVTWYLISGDYYGEFIGFNWTGSAWQTDTDIVSGLVGVGHASTPSVFERVICAPDSYNVSVNDVWHNTSPAYYNDTYTAHAWQNITVYAYNSSGGLSSGNISQDTQIPNNAITLTNASDWSGSTGENVCVDYDATDADSDTPTFSCSRMDLFTDFNTVTGTGNWTVAHGVSSVDFGVVDGWGSTSNYTMMIMIQDKVPWWDGDWDYRQQIVIKNDQPGYLNTSYVEVIVNASQCYWGDCRDMRFINVSSGLEIDFYCDADIGGFPNTTTTEKIYLEVPHIPGNGEAHIDFYFGNINSVPNECSGSGTLSFTEDFEDGDGYLERWYPSGYWYGIESYGANHYFSALPNGIFFDIDYPPVPIAYCAPSNGKLEYGYYGDRYLLIQPSGATLYFDYHAPEQTCTGSAILFGCPSDTPSTYIYDTWDTDSFSGVSDTWNDGLSHAVTMYPAFTSWESTCGSGNTKSSIDDISFLQDNVYMPPHVLGAVETRPHPYIVLYDSSRNLVQHAQVSIQNITTDETVQIWEDVGDGIIDMGTSTDVFQVAVRTFDGVFVHTCDLGANPVCEIVLPIHYNVNVYPVDQYDAPLFDVFAGLAEYTPLDPQAFWGMDLSDRGYVPVTNCSGFAMCDIIAEKDGYVDYKVEALNWTSKSALVKDYRHNVVMEEE